MAMATLLLVQFLHTPFAHILPHTHGDASPAAATTSAEESPSGHHHCHHSHVAADHDSDPHAPLPHEDEHGDCDLCQFLLKISMVQGPVSALTPLTNVDHTLCWSNLSWCSGVSTGHWTRGPPATV